MHIGHFSMFAVVVAAILAPAVTAQAQDYPGEIEEELVDVNGKTARRLACFEEVMMPAKVLVEHVLMSPEKRQYVKRRDGTLELVEYPAVYRQKRTLLEPEYVELRQIPCKKKKKWFFGF
jgi:hypothetical protein